MFWNTKNESQRQRSLYFIPAILLEQKKSFGMNGFLFMQKKYQDKKLENSTCTKSENTEQQLA